jgi:hypothetical protein
MKQPGVNKSKDPEPLNGPLTSRFRLTSGSAATGVANTK